MNQLHFKINLNKYGELRKQIETEKKVYKNTILTFVISMVVLYGFTLWINFDLNNKLQNRKKLLKNIKNEIKQFQTSGDFLSKKDLQNLEKVSDRVFWTKKLEALADKTSDKIAITHFSYSRDNLRLFGITRIDKEEKEHDLINEFIISLQNNKQISGDFPNIQFVKSRRDKEKDVDIIRFEIACRAEGE